MAARKGWSPDRRDMIRIDCNPQAGREMKDRRPLLVLSPREFNERTGIVIGLPMTPAVYHDSNPFAVRLQGTRGAPSYILGHQPKSFDWRTRKAKPRPWTKVPEDAYALACETLNQIIDIGWPQCRRQRLNRDTGRSSAGMRTQRFAARAITNRASMWWGRGGEYSGPSRGVELRASGAELVPSRIER